MRNPPIATKHDTNIDAAPHGPQYTVPSVLKLAAFWRRLAAALIDGLVVLIINTLFIGPPLGFAVWRARDGSAWIDALFFKLGIFIFAILAILVIFSYLKYCYQAHGQTIGHKALGLRVVSQAQGPLSAATSQKRAALIAFSVIGPVLVAFLPFMRLVGIGLTIVTLINYLQILWDKDNQALHDKFAGTLVIKA